MTAAAFALAFLSIAVAIALNRQGKKQIRNLSGKLAASEENSRQQAALLEDYRSRDQQLVQDASEAYFIFDREDGSLMEVNRRAEDLLGYTQGEVTHLTFKVLFSREHRHRLLRMISKSTKDGHAEIEEIKFRRKDGSQFIGSVRIKAGRINGKEAIYGSFRDTTQTTNLQLELRRHNRHLTLLNEISQRVAESRDLQHKLEIILDEVIESFAISGGGIFFLKQRSTEMKLALHRNIPDYVVEDLDQIRPGVGLAGKVVESGRPRMSTNLQKDHRRVSHTVFSDNWRAFLAVPFIADEETLGVLFVFDRGHRVFKREEVRLIQAIGRQLGPLLKNAELFDELEWQHRINFASMRELERSRAALRDNLEELEQHHRTLKSINQMKSAFLSLASHELRTPLTTIISGTEFLQSLTEGRLNENEQRALNVIMRGSQRLNHIVDDLLETARIEAKALYIAREAFNPLPMIIELIAESRPGSEARKVNLELEEFPDDAVIRGDIHHLKRALARLIENAVKFTPEGGSIHVAGRVLEKEDVISLTKSLKAFSDSFFEGPLADKYLQISVSDSGVGLEKEDHLRIFDKFQEVGDISSHSTSRASFGGKGVGLGLTITKGVIETHEGLLWVDSAGPSHGSCFSALLPLASPNDGRYVLG